MKPSWLHYTWFAYQRPLTTGAGHCLQWVLTSATAAVVLITIVECSGDQPRSSDSGCRIWGLTILWYGNHTCVLGMYGMVWHGILACTWSPLTIASLARNWFWDGNCNCLLCLCTPLPTPSTHIRYMYQFDKHFSGPPKPNMKRKKLWSLVEHPSIDWKHRASHALTTTCNPNLPTKGPSNLHLFHGTTCGQTVTGSQWTTCLQPKTVDML